MKAAPMVDELKAVEARFYSALLNRDVEIIADMMADDCTYFHSFGARDTRSSYLERLERGFFLYHELDVTQDKIIQRGDTAIIIGTMKGLVTAADTRCQLNNIRTSIWIKENDAWKLLLFQPTPWLE